MIFDTSKFALDEVKALREFAFSEGEHMICHALDTELRRRVYIRDFLLDFVEAQDQLPAASGS